MNDRQRNCFDKLRSVDPSLSEEEFLSFNPQNAVLWSWDNTEERLISKLIWLRADLHRRRELEKFDAKSWNAGRCCTQGTEKWRRKDLDPLTEGDLAALRELRYGQGLSIKGEVGDPVAIVDWFCDSSD